MTDRLPDWPRAMSIDLACAYCGVSVTTWRGLVDRDEAPKPVWVTRGRQVWLREKLDEWLDAKAGIAVGSGSEWDKAADAATT